MQLILRFLKSSIGRKILMALTGLFLIAFLAGHLVGNLQIFSPAAKINGYAEFLHGMGPLLWVARVFIFGALLVHIWTAVSLKLENRAARGPDAYAVNNIIVASLSSRTMVVTGLLLAAFFVFHILQFTATGIGDGTFKDNLAPFTMPEGYHIAGVEVVPAGKAVLDVHSMVVAGFLNPWVSLAYAVAIALLCVHLLHGAQSAFQTLGWRNARWSAFLRGAAVLFVAVYLLANLAIPAAILGGAIKPRAGAALKDGSPVPAFNCCAKPKVHACHAQPAPACHAPKTAASGSYQCDDPAAGHLCCKKKAEAKARGLKTCGKECDQPCCKRAPKPAAPSA
ncbi:MAG: succinate dehydrogenase cytochrome b subunit [Opitutaceae bacterium]|jgi:succinate dehydrogenase / fumarate reductase cytochrome b subunit|nr:succinate dehydrogenase cytochrome b subunit [Opitutaceae bacterium]